MASSFPHQGVFALRFALNVFIGSTVVWHTLLYLDVPNPLWAVAAPPPSSSPQA